MKFKKILLSLLLVTLLQQVFAQNIENKFAISIFGGINQYNGDLGNGLSDFKNLNPLGTTSFSVYLNNSLDIGLQLGIGKYSYSNSSLNKSFSGKKTDGFIFLNYKFANNYIINSSSFISPLITAGVGLAGYSGDNIYDTASGDIIFPLGAGLNFNINKKTAISYRFIYTFTNRDSHDNNISSGKNDGYGEHLFGITFSFGDTGVKENTTLDEYENYAAYSPMDDDKDGVSNDNDKCPGTPLGIRVDKNGCPLDTDGDGVPDYYDKCPDTPEGVKVDAKGCPLDGKNDTVTGEQNKNTDKNSSKNVNTAIGTNTKQNPTADNTTTGTNSKAKPNSAVNSSTTKTSAPLNTKKDSNISSVDSDGDGVSNYLDKCPNQAGTLANNGCPETKSENKKASNDVLIGAFDLEKGALKTNAYPLLDKYVTILKEHPEYKLQLDGYTDSTGNKVFNKHISKVRADAVKAYMVKQGINASRITTLGHGIEDPVADNSTAEGQYQNRRIEFTIIY